MKEVITTTTCDRCIREKQKGACGWTEFDFIHGKGDLCRECTEIVFAVIYKPDLIDITQRGK